MIRTSLYAFASVLSTVCVVTTAPVNNTPIGSQTNRQQPSRMTGVQSENPKHAGTPEPHC